jgi:hypothetical protein
MWRPGQSSLLGKTFRLLADRSFTNPIGCSDSNVTTGLASHSLEKIALSTNASFSAANSGVKTKASSSCLVTGEALLVVFRKAMRRAAGITAIEASKIREHAKIRPQLKPDDDFSIVIGQAWF